MLVITLTSVSFDTPKRMGEGQIHMKYIMCVLKEMIVTGKPIAEWKAIASVVFIPKSMLYSPSSLRRYTNADMDAEHNSSSRLSTVSNTSAGV